MSRFVPLLPKSAKRARRLFVAFTHALAAVLDRATDARQTQIVQRLLPKSRHANETLPLLQPWPIASRVSRRGYGAAMRFLSILASAFRCTGGPVMPPDDWPERYRLLFFRLSEMARADGVSQRLADEIAWSWSKSFKLEVEKIAAKEAKRVH